MTNKETYTESIIISIYDSLANKLNKQQINQRDKYKLTNLYIKKKKKIHSQTTNFGRLFRPISLTKEEIKL